MHFWCNFFGAFFSAEFCPKSFSCCRCLLNKKILAEILTAVAVQNGKIFVTGGFDGHRRLDSAEMFDTFTNQWAPLPNMSRARFKHVSTIHQDKLYVYCYDLVSEQLDLDDINKGWSQSRWRKPWFPHRLAETHKVEVDMTASLRTLISPKKYV